jgi:hypothetical protein
MPTGSLNHYKKKERNLFNSDKKAFCDRDACFCSTKSAEQNEYVSVCLRLSAVNYEKTHSSFDALKHDSSSGIQARCSGAP